MNERRSTVRTMLHVTRDFQEYHDHAKYDPATKDNYFMRLPGGLPVPISSFERRKKELLEKMDIKDIK